MNMSLSRTLRDRLRFIIPSVVAIAVFNLTISLYFLPNMKLIVKKQKESFIQEAVGLPIQICEYYAGLVKEGEMDGDFARGRAAEIIKELDYGTERKDYFWILDTTPVLLMHPYRSDLVGTDVSNYVDESGTPVFLEMVKVAESKGAGFVRYRWQVRDSREEIGQKLSYISYFEPWDWIIGTGIYREDIERELASMGRSLFWVSLLTVVLVGLILLFLIQQGISVQKRRSEAVAKLNESRNRYKQLIDLMHEGIMVIDTRGCFTFVNNRFCKMLGRDRKELIGSRLDDCLKNGSKPVVHQEMEKLPSGRESNYNAEWETEDGKRLATIVSPRGLFDSHGTYLGSFAVVTDITDQKLTEEKLTSLLKEKTVLLKEIHHRVKNNLQLMSSLCSLEYQNAADDSVKRVLYDSKLRIQTISRVHELLYQSDNLKDISMRKYLDQLIMEIRSSFTGFKSASIKGDGVSALSRGNVRFGLDADEIMLSVEYAIPCGLIINELVSNSLKHAFPEDQTERIINIFFLQYAGKVRFGVEDNGIGLPGDFLRRDSKSLGIELVRTLAEQLKGKIIIYNDENTEGSRVEILVPQDFLV
ncbi:MAG: cache domain-containing protein [Spirochaetia bacterium]